MLSGRVEDVYLVPVSITYDQLREVSAMAAEQAGAKKQAEGLQWLADYARTQRVPRSARPTSGSASRSRCGPGCRRPGPRQDEVRTALQKIAFEVAVGINRTSPLTANALVTLALLGVRDQALTLSQIRRVLEPILAYIEARELPSTGLERLSDPEGLAAVLMGMVRAKVVTIFDKGEEPVYAIERGQHLVAAFYRNNAIHRFVNRAILELALLWTPSRRGTATRRIPSDRLDRGQAVRDLLKFEFFFPDRDSFEAQLRAELALLAPGAPDAADRAQRHRGPDGAPGAAVLPRRPARRRRPARATSTPGRRSTEKALLDECDRVGSRCCSRAGCTGPSRCPASCSPPRSSSRTTRPAGSRGRRVPRGARPSPA